MVFSSLCFLFLFMPLVLTMYYGLCRTRGSKNLLLLFASLFFYAWGEPYFVFLMICSIVVNWGFGILAADGGAVRRKTVCVAALVFNIGLLFYFKYSVFALFQVTRLFDLNFSMSIILPIGISFFTFQALSYVLDVIRGTVAVRRNLFDVGLYIALFPQLVAGPIVKFRDLAPQIQNRTESGEMFYSGIKTFIIGLGKKVLLANSFAYMADQAFELAPNGGLSIGGAWIGAVAYSLQIYFDFSGYSDMAIGLGRMFGFEFPHNFNYPYAARSISDFWRRWHISLGTWFRDYVYIPLGGNRTHSKWHLAYNLGIVWLLTGIWHGANWTFFLWGLWFFIFILLEKLLCWRITNPFLNVIGHVYALLVVLFGWVLFRANSLTEAIDYFRCMLGVSENTMSTSLWTQNFLFIALHEFRFEWILGVLFLFPVYPWIRKKIRKKHDLQLSRLCRVGIRPTALNRSVGTIGI